MAKKKSAPKRKVLDQQDLTEVFHKNNLVNGGVGGNNKTNDGDNSDSDIEIISVNGDGEEIESICDDDEDDDDVVYVSGQTTAATMLGDRGKENFDFSIKHSDKLTLSDKLKLKFGYDLTFKPLDLNVAEINKTKSPAHSPKPKQRYMAGSYRYKTRPAKTPASPDVNFGMKIGETWTDVNGSWKSIDRQLVEISGSESDDDDSVECAYFSDTLTDSDNDDCRCVASQFCDITEQRPDFNYFGFNTNLGSALDASFWSFCKYMTDENYFSVPKNQEAVWKVLDNVNSRPDYVDESIDPFQHTCEPKSEKTEDVAPIVAVPDMSMILFDKTPKISLKKLPDKLDFNNINIKNNDELLPWLNGSEPVHEKNEIQSEPVKKRFFMKKSTGGKGYLPKRNLQNNVKNIKPGPKCYKTKMHDKNENSLPDHTVTPTNEGDTPFKQPIKRRKRKPEVERLLEQDKDQPKLAKPDDPYDFKDNDGTPRIRRRQSTQTRSTDSLEESFIEGEEIEGLTLCYLHGDIVPVRRSKRVASEKHKDDKVKTDRPSSPKFGANDGHSNSSTADTRLTEDESEDSETEKSSETDIREPIIINKNGNNDLFADSTPINESEEEGPEPNDQSLLDKEETPLKRTRSKRTSNRLTKSLHDENNHENEKTVQKRRRRSRRNLSVIETEITHDLQPEEKKTDAEIDGAKKTQAGAGKVTEDDSVGLEQSDANLPINDGHDSVKENLPQPITENIENKLTIATEKQQVNDDIEKQQLPYKNEQAPSEIANETSITSINKKEDLVELEKQQPPNNKKEVELDAHQPSNDANEIVKQPPSKATEDKVEKQPPNKATEDKVEKQKQPGNKATEDEVEKQKQPENNTKDKVEKEKQPESKDKEEIVKQPPNSKKEDGFEKEKQPENKVVKHPPNNRKEKKVEIAKQTVNKDKEEIVKQPPNIEKEDGFEEEKQPENKFVKQPPSNRKEEKAEIEKQTENKDKEEIVKQPPNNAKEEKVEEEKQPENKVVKRPLSNKKEEKFEKEKQAENIDEIVKQQPNNAKEEKVEEEKQTENNGKYLELEKQPPNKKKENKMEFEQETASNDVEAEVEDNNLLSIPEKKSSLDVNSGLAQTFKFPKEQSSSLLAICRDPRLRARQMSRGDELEVLMKARRLEELKAKQQELKKAKITLLDETIVPKPIEDLCKVKAAEETRSKVSENHKSKAADANKSKVPEETIDLTKKENELPFLDNSDSDESQDVPDSLNESIKSKDGSEQQKSDPKKTDKKRRKSVDTELVYKTPLSDLHSETDERSSYSSIPKKHTQLLHSSNTPYKPRDPRNLKSLVQMSEKEKIAHDLRLQLMQERAQFRNEMLEMQKQRDMNPITVPHAFGHPNSFNDDMYKNNQEHQILSPPNANQHGAHQLAQFSQKDIRNVESTANVQMKFATQEVTITNISPLLQSYQFTTRVTQELQNKNMIQHNFSGSAQRQDFHPASSQMQPLRDEQPIPSAYQDPMFYQQYQQQIPTLHQSQLVHSIQQLPMHMQHQQALLLQQPMGQLPPQQQALLQQQQIMHHQPLIQQQSPMLQQQQSPMLQQQQPPMLQQQQPPMLQQQPPPMLQQQQSPMLQQQQSPMLQQQQSPMLQQQARHQQHPNINGEYFNHRDRPKLSARPEKLRSPPFDDSSSGTKRNQPLEQNGTKDFHHPPVLPASKTREQSDSPSRRRREFVPKHKEFVNKRSFDYNNKKIEEFHGQNDYNSKDVFHRRESDFYRRDGRGSRDRDRHHYHKEDFSRRPYRHERSPSSPFSRRASKGSLWNESRDSNDWKRRRRDEYSRSRRYSRSRSRSYSRDRSESPRYRRRSRSPYYRRRSRSRSYESSSMNSSSVSSSNLKYKDMSLSPDDH